jgi:LETM1 and EF-hand domain-containing protein 1
MELARFLQQTVAEVARDVRRSGTGTVAADAKALYSFLKDVRAGKSVSNMDILQFASLFNDEITLDNLDRVHLVTLCQVRTCLFMLLEPRDFTQSQQMQDVPT